MSDGRTFCVELEQQDGFEFRVRFDSPQQADPLLDERDARGRHRIAGIDVSIALPEGPDALPHLDRCLAQFEGFCIVTESVRRGIPVRVQVDVPTAMER